MSHPITARLTLTPAPSALIERLEDLIYEGGDILDRWETQCDEPHTTGDRTRHVWEVEWAWGLRRFLHPNNTDAHELVRDLIAAQVAFTFLGEGDIGEERALYAWAPGEPHPTLRDADADGHPMLTGGAYERLHATVASGDDAAFVAALGAYMRPPRIAAM